jgi:hypothetical protein
MKWNELENNTRVRIIQLSVVALFLISSIPFGVWLITGKGETWAWVFPVVLVASGFIAIVAWLIKNAVKE